MSPHPNSLSGLSFFYHVLAYYFSHRSIISFDDINNASELIELGEKASYNQTMKNTTQKECADDITLVLRLGSGLIKSDLTQTQIQKFSIDMCDFMKQKTGYYLTLTDNFDNPVLKQAQNNTNFREIMDYFKQRGWTPEELGKIFRLAAKMSTFGQ